jgi:hypothetical protein
MIAVYGQEVTGHQTKPTAELLKVNAFTEHTLTLDIQKEK